MADETRVRWQNLSGQERLQVIERARQGLVTQTELCRAFGMSRQVLHRALKTVEEAATEALEPKRPGRKKPPASETRIKELEQSVKQKERELSNLQQKCEVMQTLLELERKLDRGERLPGEEKKRKRRR